MARDRSPKPTADRGGGDAGALLAVGHTERFNPAVAAARPLLADPRFIEVHRLGTFPERSLDIDVVFDLMIHDLDVVLSIVHSEVGVDRGGRRAGADRPRRHRQRAAAVRQRLHRQPHRQPHQPRPRAEDPVLPADGLLSIDYAAQKVEVLAAGHAADGADAVDPGRRSSTWSNEEPLKRELADFVDAVRVARAPLVTGDDGRRALELAQQITDKMTTECSARSATRAVALLSCSS